jgi:phage terminase small subunit
MVKPKAINGLQQRFVQEYVIDMNAVQAAIRAGYSPDSAPATAYRLMADPDIAEAIQLAASKKLAAIEERGITGDRVLAEFSKICMADLRKILRSDGSMLPMDEWPDEMAGAVSSLKMTEKRDGSKTVEIKIWDKIGALTAMAKHYGLLVDKSEVSGVIKYGWLGDDDDPPVEAESVTSEPLALEPGDPDESAQ